MHRAYCRMAKRRGRTHFMKTETLSCVFFHLQLFSSTKFDGFVCYRFFLDSFWVRRCRVYEVSCFLLFSFFELLKELGLTCLFLFRLKSKVKKVIYIESLFKKKDIDSGSGETLSGSLLCRPTTTIGRKNCCNCREIRSEEKRRPRVVLQSTSETKENEIRCSALTTATDGLANWFWLLIKQQNVFMDHESLEINSIHTIIGDL